MAFNIKNEDCDSLVRELVEVTGLSLTDAVTQAVREKLERERAAKPRRRATAEEIMEIGRRFAVGIPKQMRKVDINKLLYDKNGLPK